MDTNEVSPEKEVVYRKGKRTIKKSCPPEYVLRKGTCQKMSSKEKAARSLAAKKAAKTRRSTASSKLSRAKSLSMRAKS